MVLQAYFDDSGNSPDQKILAIAGLISDSDRWDRFSEEWRRAINRGPVVQSVKYREIVRGKGQFDDRHGWSAKLRAERLSELVDIIIRNTEPAGLFHALEHQHFYKHIARIPFAVREAINGTPYARAADAVVAWTAVYLCRRGLSEPCDFYFDQSSVAEDWMLDLWPAIQAIPDEVPSHLLPHGVRPTIGRLFFGSDGDLLPLQAADIVAGMIRDMALGVRVHPSLDQLRSLPLEGKFESEDSLEESGRRLRRRAQRFRFRHPSAPMIGFDPKLEARRRKLNRRERRAHKSD